jgi:hypothetical protein
VRIQVGSVSIVFSDRWTPGRRVLEIQRANREGSAVAPSVHGTVVRSPRRTGTFELEVVPDALSEDGVRELASTNRPAALAKLVDAGLETFAPLVSEPFDRDWGTGEGVAWRAFTILWKVTSTSKALQIQRDWFVAAKAEGDPPNRDLVLASYRGNGSGDAASDIVECADMVQTIRFEP